MTSQRNVFRACKMPQIHALSGYLMAGLITLNTSTPILILCIGSLKTRNLNTVYAVDFCHTHF